MAGEHGGYRRPSNPAPVSGPGANSRRTDGHPAQMALPDAQYGEAQDFQQVQQGAQMGSPVPSAPAVSAPARPIIPIGAPSQEPTTPVTAGADMGPGPSSAVLGLDAGQLDAEQYGRYLPFLLKLANDPNTSKSTRLVIRQLFARS